MWRVLAGFVAALAIAALPRVSLADEEQRPPERPNPEMLLKRLDSNQDGKVTADEIPEAAPEQLKAMLRGADNNDDKVITKEELAAAMQRHRPGPPGRGALRRAGGGAAARGDLRPAGAAPRRAPPATHRLKPSGPGLSRALPPA